MTIWAARANFMEHAAGSIAVGKYADFAVLDRDWMRVAPEAVMATRVLATYSSGKPVYEAPMAGRRPRCARAAGAAARAAARTRPDGSSAAS